MAEVTKTATVTDIQVNVRQFKEFFIHIISFNNGDKGDYISKSATCEKFTKGVESKYVLRTDITERNGQSYTNIKVKPFEDKPQGGAKKKDDYGVITALACIKAATLFHHRNLLASDKDVLESAEKYYQYAITKTTLNT